MDPEELQKRMRKLETDRRASRNGYYAVYSFGFTLVELLVVLGLIVTISAFLVPAFTGINTSRNVTRSAYAIAGALENARTYAMAYNTYTWVGFFEEDGGVSSRNPAVEGTGRVIVSSIYSLDGTQTYNGVPSLDNTRLSALDKLLKVENTHLTSFPLDRTTSGNRFESRPVPTASPIGSTSVLKFFFPLGSAASQYTFANIIQFNPRGEARVNLSSSALEHTLEIGLQPTHGDYIDNQPGKRIAIQLTGIAGDVKIFRP